MAATGQCSFSELSLIDDDIQNENTNLSFQNYKIRYIELSRPIAGAVLGVINYELVKATDLNDSSVIMVGNSIANFGAWVLGEKIIHPICVSSNWYIESKSKNPLYRNFKTLASIGTSIGTIFSIIISSQKNLKLNTAAYSAFAGFILGISAFIYRMFRQLWQERYGHQDNIDEQVGVEGWSKYTKVALTFGTLLGQGIGGYISFVNGCDDINSWSKINLYGSLASVISFISIALVVPIVNYLTRNKNDLSSRGILVTNDVELFNANYVRSGMTLGTSIGTILGGLIGPAIITGLNPAIGIAVGAGVFAILNGLLLGVYGYGITLYLRHNWGVHVNTDNSWSYATRNASYVFGFIGTLIACILFPGASLLQTVTFGSAIASLIGWFVGLGVLWTARFVEPNEQKMHPKELPWTQRVSMGANRGAIIGSFVGLFFSLCVGGPLGLVGWVTFCGALLAVLGSITEGLADPVARRIIGKILLIDNIIPREESILPASEISEDLKSSRVVQIRPTKSAARSSVLNQNLRSSSMFFSTNHSIIKSCHDNEIMGLCNYRSSLWQSPLLGDGPGQCP